ncbi:MAG: hypothetical protein RL757_366 [Bacteroidota bacterium]|jgi:hypothetical protein
MEYFENLTDAELLLLQDALPYIAVLVSGADGEIDEEERNWAAKLSHIRSFANAHKELLPFYEQIQANFKSKFSEFLKDLPADATQRNARIGEILSPINAILPKLSPKLSYSIYHSYVTFAKRVAEVSGGFFGFGSITAEESVAMRLRFLTPIAEPPKPTSSDLSKED